MQVQFNSDSSVMGTENVAERIEASVREKLARFEERLTRIEIHVRDENGAKGGADDKACTIEARPTRCCKRSHGRSAQAACVSRGRSVPPPRGGAA